MVVMTPPSTNTPIDHDEAVNNEAWPQYYPPHFSH
jgi:hypothetical protein